MQTHSKLPFLTAVDEDFEWLSLSEFVGVDEEVDGMLNDTTLSFVDRKFGNNVDGI